MTKTALAAAGNVLETQIGKFLGKIRPWGKPARQTRTAGNEKKKKTA